MKTSASSKVKAFLLYIIVFITAIQFSYGQTSTKYANEDLSHLAKVDITYLIASAKDSNAQKYFKVLKENWKLTPKVELLSEDEISNKIETNALFIQSRTQNFPRLGGYMLWSFNDKAISQPKKAFEKTLDGKSVFFNMDYAADIYHFQSLLYPMDSTHPYFVFSEPDKALYCWGEGIFKSKIQAWQWYVNQYNKSPEPKKVAKQMATFANPEQLKNLKTGTLYVPDYLLTRYGGTVFNHDTKPALVDKVMAPYPFTYKVIKSKELNDMLIKGQSFYYLDVLMLRDNELLLQVINGKTGEIVYNHHTFALFVDAPVIKILTKEMID
ncbi:MAG: hypothetical protein JWO03_1263 [Bacteroidetes bacterium]|nr:hypothetical protein [Bacteroidota bacterium]